MTTTRSPAASRLARILPVAALGVALLAGVGFQADGGDAGGYVVPGVTKPNEDLQLAFPVRGRVGEVLVKKGDTVVPGDVLVTLDDAAQQASLERARVEAEVRGPTLVALREAELDKAKLDLQIALDANKDGRDVYNESEIREREILVKQAEAQLDVAKADVEGSRAEMQAQQASVDMMRIESPVEGIVREVTVGAGEAADEQRPSVIVVQSDPLKISVVDLNSAQVALLKVGQTVPVTYDKNEMQDEIGTVQATITYIDPQVEAGSKIHLIELEMPNPEGVESGRDVRVMFPIELQKFDDMRRRRR